MPVPSVYEKEIVWDAVSFFSVRQVNCGNQFPSSKMFFSFVSSFLKFISCFFFLPFFFQVDCVQMEVLGSLFHNECSLVLANNERIHIPDNIRFYWEVSSLSVFKINFSFLHGFYRFQHQDYSDMLCVIVE